MAEILIYDDIGPEWLGMVSAKGVLDAIAAVPPGEEITVRVNSPGGSVNEALAIYNALDRRGGVTIAVDGIAASSASFIAMAGDKIVMAANAMMMIHNPWTVAIGDHAEMRKVADILDKYGGQLAATYATRSSKSVQEIQQAMDAETWYTAQEAVAAGLADSIGTATDAKASVAPGRFIRTPANLLDDQAAVAARAKRQSYLMKTQLTLRGKR